MRKKELDWEEIEPLLGTKSDRKIASMYKVSANPIRNRRYRVNKLKGTRTGAP